MRIFLDSKITGDATDFPMLGKSNGDSLRPFLAAFLGWSLDAFDFFVLTFVLSRIGHDFQATEAQMTRTITATLALRPVGAIIFGLFADRHGRRLSMMINLALFSLMEIFSGLAPGYRSFLICRALFGIGMGGYWGVAMPLAMEKIADPKRQGFFSGLLQEGYMCGQLLAGCFYALLPAAWGWRPLFLLGGLPAVLLIGFIYWQVGESDVWKQSRKTGWIDLLRAIAGGWKLLLYLTVLMTVMNFSSHGTQDLYPTFLEKERNLPRWQIGEVVFFYSIGAILGGVAFGILSDRIGRRPAMMTAFALAICVIWLWVHSPGIALLAVGAFLMQFMVQGAWGIIPAYTKEISPDSVRSSLTGLPYQCGVLLAADVAHLESQFSHHAGKYSTGLSWVALATFSVGILVVAFNPKWFAREANA
jgi:SHS family lactate transporter-like MFS transporter